MYVLQGSDVLLFLFLAAVLPVCGVSGCDVNLFHNVTKVLCPIMETYSATYGLAFDIKFISESSGG